MCVCIYVYIYMCVYIYVYVCIYVYIYMNVCIFIYPNLGLYLIKQIFLTIFINKLGREKLCYLFIYFQVLLVRRILPVTLIQTWLGASECTHTRYRIKTVCRMFTFIIRRDWEGSDISRFSLANNILKTH